MDLGSLDLGLVVAILGVIFAVIGAAQALVQPAYDQWRRRGETRQFLLLGFALVVTITLVGVNALVVTGEWGQFQVVLVGTDVGAGVVVLTVYLLIVQMDATRQMVKRDNSQAVLEQLKLNVEKTEQLLGEVANTRKELSTTRELLDGRLPPKFEPEVEDDG